MKIIFLDIDGVLNGHDWDEAAQSNRIRHRCVEQLSRILGETGAKIVLSSAWRYMIHCGAMTTIGFEYMLRTHGASGIVHKIVGVTIKDEDTPGYLGAGHVDGSWEPRTKQIRMWLEDHPGVTEFVVIDDADLVDFGERFVQTDGATGLTEDDANRAIDLLNANDYRGCFFCSKPDCHNECLESEAT